MLTVGFMSMMEAGLVLLMATSGRALDVTRFAVDQLKSDEASKPGGGCFLLLIASRAVESSRPRTLRRL